MRVNFAFSVYLLGVVALGGCAIGDSAVRIKGSVQDERGKPSENCKIELLYGDGDRPLDYRIISKDFLVTFVVSPNAQEYKLRIQCGAALKTYISGPFAVGTHSYDIPIDLGVIIINQ